MSGFFDRMAQRATGTETRWQARPRAPFEPAVPRTDPRGDAPDGAPGDRRGVRPDDPRIGGSRGIGVPDGSLRGGQANSAPADDDGARDNGARDNGARGDGARDEGASSQVGTGRGPSAGSLTTPARTPVGDGRGLAEAFGREPDRDGHLGGVGSQIAAARPGAPRPEQRDRASAARRATVQVPSLSVPSATDRLTREPPARSGPNGSDEASPDLMASAENAAAVGDWRLPGRAREDLLSADLRGDEYSALLARDAVDRGRARADDSAADAGRDLAPDTEILLREHVVPALRSRGLLAPGERAELIDPTGELAADRPRAPHPGRAGVGHGEVRRGEPTAIDSRTTEVHVHIDRVEVVRAAPVAAPPPAAPTAVEPPEPSRLDAYLEQRQARRR
ncbi:MAG: hypothetical protein ACOH2F_05890 [Cellulomonas sp.]